MKIPKLFTIAFCLLTVNCFAQGKQTVINSPYDFADLTKKLEASKKELGKEFTMLIYKDGKPVYDKKFGEELDKRTPVTIGASTQWLTATLVMTFVDEGKLTLDTKVADYLPAFTKYGKGYITIRHCLAHMTGIKAKKTVGGFDAKGKTDKLEDEVNEIVAKEIENNAGEAVWLSNYGPIIAARVLEVLTKKPFDRLMTERILRPLMMRGTNFNAEKAINAAGGATSMAMDYINLTTMILNKGMFNGRKILSEDAINQMFTAQNASIPIKYVPEAVNSLDIGLGTFIHEKDDTGKATVVSCPSFFGTTAVIDLCRGYSYVLITKDGVSETKKELYASIKSTIDQAIGGNCK